MADIAPLVTNPSRLPGILAPALGAAPMLATAPVMTGPSFADVATMAKPTLPAIAPVHNAALDTPVQQAQANLSRLQSTGSGIDQIKNPFVRGIAKAGDIAGAIAGSVFAPLRVAESLIPGTNEHHDYLVHKAQAQLGNAQENEQSTAKVAQENALAKQEIAKAESYTDPQKAVDPSKTVQTDNRIMQWNPATSRFDIPVGDRVQKPQSMDEMAYEAALKQSNGDPIKAISMVYGAKNQKDAGLPQQYLNAIASGDTHKADLIRKVINDTSVQPKIDVHNAEVRPAAEAGGTWQPLVDKDGNTKFFNTKTAQIIDNPTGIAKVGAHGKLGADEQKRADLAKNLNENINSMEEILQRRPELFGPLAGRMTDAKATFGTNDTDIAKMVNIKHQLGMVAQGTHGMRSAQGIESAANSLLGGFHNSPAATKAALESARTSAATFLDDANHPGASRGPGPSVGAVEDGHRFKGGNPADPSNWEKVSK